MDSNKKKKILIGAGVGSFVIVTLFAFLIFNHDKSTVPASKEVTSVNTDEKSKKQKEISAADKLPFKEVVYNGKKVQVEAGDVVISDDGKLLLSSDFLSKKLKTPVSWKDQTVYIGQQPITGTDEVANYISDMDYLKIHTENDEQFDEGSSVLNDKWDDNKLFTIAGTQYNKGLGFQLNYPSTGWDNTPLSIFMDYNLASKYKTLKAKVGVDDQFKNSVSTFIVRVYGDDKLLHETKPFKGGDFAIPIEVNVSSVIKLTFEVDKQDDDSGKSEKDTKVVIADPIVK